jgi:hypothetical protein
MKALPVIAFAASAIVARFVEPGGGDSPHPISFAGPATAAAAAPLPASPASADDCHGGEDDPISVALEPQAIDGARATIGIHVHQHLDTATDVVGAVELIDDRGRRIGLTTDLALRRVAPRTATTYRFDTPDRLPDGYYRVQLTVLARAERALADADDFSTHQLYFHVARGITTPVTSDEWLTRSEAGLAFKAPDERTSP